MWRAAGGKDVFEIDGLTAAATVPRLTSALAALKRDPERFKAMNAPNGWGTYEDLLEVLSGMVDAACSHPYARWRVRP